MGFGLSMYSTSYIWPRSEECHFCFARIRSATPIKCELIRHRPSQAYIQFMVFQAPLPWVSWVRGWIYWSVTQFVELDSGLHRSKRAKMPILDAFELFKNAQNSVAIRKVTDGRCQVFSWAGIQIIVRFLCDGVPVHFPISRPVWLTVESCYSVCQVVLRQGLISTSNFQLVFILRVYDIFRSAQRRSNYHKYLHIHQYC